ncbi:MAG: hypothetical protein QOJ29_251 [Thermoleophilaceae bacterium]|jgi:hypothetical protein|nr:hypothetical protein [Thermoleophilaceae bacterium]
MSDAVAIPDTNLAALAKLKLATGFLRGPELGRIEEVLELGEEVITLADALFRSGRQERRGLIVLTEQRLMGLDSTGGKLNLLIRLETITALERGAARGDGDAKRGDLTIIADGVETNFARIRPWERAEEIARHIEGVVKKAAQ